MSYQLLQLIIYGGVCCFLFFTFRWGHLVISLVPVFEVLSYVYQIVEERCVQDLPILESLNLSQVKLILFDLGIQAFIAHYSHMLGIIAIALTIVRDLKPIKNMPVVPDEGFAIEIEWLRWFMLITI